MKSSTKTKDLPQPRGGDPVAKPKLRMLSYKPVGAVIACLSVLRYLARSTKPLSLTNIARDLDLNSSTCLNILRTLANENYVTFDPEARLYSLGLGPLELIGGILSSGGDMSAVRTLMDRVSESERVTTTLWRRIRQDRIQLVMESVPSGEVSIRMELGQRLPLVLGAAGQLMAAFSDLSAEEIEGQFERVRFAQRPNIGEFLAELEKVRQRGWAVDDQRYASGISTVSVPILNEKNHAIYAFSATTFSSRYSAQKRDSILRELNGQVSLLTSALHFM